MPTYLKKDIITVTEGVIAHGVNCQRVMGSGVAKAIKEKWPVVYNAYMNTYGGEQILGSCHVVQITSNLYVANCYTQIYYGRDGKRYADSKAIENALNVVIVKAKILGEERSYKPVPLPLYMPKIGCGLGGLDWGLDVEPIISKLERKHNIEIFVCEI